MSNPIRVTVWSEFRHEKRNPKVQAVYPNGIHEVIADGLRRHGFAVQTATLDEPEHGLTEQVLLDTDVLTWWGHITPATSRKSSSG
jgi:trehalose utilization protein